jgi:cytochrome c553
MEETKNGLTRRSFLSSSALGMGVLAAGLTAGSLINPREAEAAVLTYPVPTVPLDEARIADLGFYWYKKGTGCGHGSARALIQGFSEACTKSGISPGGWDDINRNLYAWCNSGGPGSYGVLCGSIAGAVGVMNLIGRQGDIGRAIFDWYIKQPFPGNFDHLTASFDGSIVTVPGGSINTGHGAAGSGPLNTSVPIPFAETSLRSNVAPDSPLCHVSVSKWMAAAGVFHGQLDANGMDIRSDRCAKVTAETAGECARLYNVWKSQGTVVGWSKPAAMAGCYDCHDTNGTTIAQAQPPLTNRSTQTKMDCLPCHTEPVSGRK